MERVGQEPHYRGCGSYLTVFLFTFSLENRGMDLAGQLSNLRPQLLKLLELPKKGGGASGRSEEIARASYGRGPQAM
jgi:hypothetical protein